MALSLATELEVCEVVINAAGDARAASNDEATLFTANALLPTVIREACEVAEVVRFIHINSAAVQGDLDELDSSATYQPNSPYARSKVLAEEWLRDCEGKTLEIVIYRPPGVHAPGRAVTKVIRRMSAWGLLPVAGDGSAPTPQASLENIADTVRFLVGSSIAPPNIVHHPWEGLTCEGFLVAMGGRDPWHLPTPIANAILRLLLAGEKMWPRVAPQRRRRQLLCFGQPVAASWLSQQGWVPSSPIGGAK